MAGELRCFEGHVWRYEGSGGNDPAGETDMGVCPDCLGRGCENRADEQDQIALLTDIAQLLDGKKTEGCAWSEWDQEVRERVSKHLYWMMAPKIRDGLYDPVGPF